MQSAGAHRPLTPLLAAAPDTGAESGGGALSPPPRVFSDTVLTELPTPATSTAKPSLQLVLSRVIASSENLSLQLERSAAGEGSHKGVDAAQATAVRTHINALIACKAQLLESVRLAQEGARRTGAHMAEVKRACVSLRQENARYRWALSSAEIKDMKEDVVMAFLQGKGKATRLSAEAEARVRAKERAVFAEQLAAAEARADELQGVLDLTASELTTLRVERDTLASMRKKAELEADALRARLRQADVDVAYRLALDERERAGTERLASVEAKAEAEAYRMLLSGSLEEARVQFEALLAHHHERMREAELASAAALARRVPAGRLLTVRSIRARNVPDMDLLPESGESDPYVKLALLDVHGRIVDELVTPYKRNERNPVWTETYHLYAPHGASAPLSLHVKLVDKDWKQSDSEIGSYRVAVQTDGTDPAGKPIAVEQTVKLRKKVLKNAQDFKPEPPVTVAFEYAVGQPLFFDAPDSRA